MKEADKNDGHINYSKFIIGRFTRLIFVIVPKAIIYGLVFGWWTGVAAVLFITNFTGQPNELWSVSMEMQFYLVSPCIIMYLRKEKIPLTIAFIIGLLSVVTTLGIGHQVAPELIKNPRMLNGNNRTLTNKTVSMKIFHNVYLKTYCRMMPYGIGIYLAYKFMN